MKLGELGYRLFLFTCLLNWMAFLLWIIGFNQFRLGLLAACGLMYFTSGFLSIGNLSKIPYRRFTNIKIGFFLSYFLFILCRSFYLYTFGSNQTSFGTFFYDITSFGLIFSSISLIGRTKKELTYFFLVYLLMVILSIVITIPHMTLETLIAADRTQAFQGLEGVRSVDSLQLGILGLSTFMVIICFFAIKKRLYKILSICILLVFIVIGLYYQKRNVFLEVIVLGALIMVPSLFSVKKIKSLFTLGLVSILGLLYILNFTNFSNNIFYNATQATIERVDVNEAAAQDRLEESIIFFNTYKPHEYILGKGFAFTVPNTVGGHVIHIGFSNLVLKGGFIYMLFILIVLLKHMFYAVFIEKKHKTLYWGINLMVFLLLSYSPLYGWQPNTAMLGLAIFSTEFVKSLET